MLTDLIIIIRRRKRRRKIMKIQKRPTDLTIFSSSNPHHKSSSSTSSSSNSILMSFWYRITLIFKVIIQLISRLIHINNDELLNSIKVWMYHFKNRSTSYRKDLLEWVRIQTKGAFKPQNATSDWSNGIILCGLIDSIIPGVCSRYEMFNPTDHLKNMSLAVNILRESLSMDPIIKVDKMIRGENERQLLYLLSRLKLITAKRKMRRGFRRPLIKLTDSSGNSTDVPLGSSDISSVGDDDSSVTTCFAKGMGLQLAVVGRKASFNIYVKSVVDLDLVIEIIGPESGGSHNIKKSFKHLWRSSSSLLSSHNFSSADANFSQTSSDKNSTGASSATKSAGIPKENSNQSHHVSSKDHMTSSLSSSSGQHESTACSSSSPADTTCDNHSNKIAISCEIKSDHLISVSYVPIQAGKHKLNIIWEGMHILGSPYIIKVDRRSLSTSQSSSGENYYSSTAAIIMDHHYHNTCDNPLSPDIVPSSSHLTSGIISPQQQPASSSSPFFSSVAGKVPLKSKVIRKTILERVILINGVEHPMPKPDEESLKTPSTFKRRKTSFNKGSFVRQDHFDYPPSPPSPASPSPHNSSEKENFEPEVDPLNHLKPKEPLDFLNQYQSSDTYIRRKPLLPLEIKTPDKEKVQQNSSMETEVSLNTSGDMMWGELARDESLTESKDLLYEDFAEGALNVYQGDMRKIEAEFQSLCQTVTDYQVFSSSLRKESPSGKKMVMSAKKGMKRRSLKKTSTKKSLMPDDDVKIDVRRGSATSLVMVAPPKDLVKERKKLFETIAHETKDDVKDDREVDRSVKYVVPSVSEKRKFWESLKSSDDEKKKFSGPIVSNKTKSSNKKSKRRSVSQPDPVVICQVLKDMDDDQKKSTLNSSETPTPDSASSDSGISASNKNDMISNMMMDVDVNPHQVQRKIGSEPECDQHLLVHEDLVDEDNHHDDYERHDGNTSPMSPKLGRSKTEDVPSPESCSPSPQNSLMRSASFPELKLTYGATPGMISVVTGRESCDVSSVKQVPSDTNINRRISMMSRASGFIDDDLNDALSFAACSQQDIDMVISKSLESKQNMETRFGQPKPIPSNVVPENVRAIGKGAYFGYVGIKNSFRIMTTDAGPGFLSVGITGNAAGAVKKVSYTRLTEDMFEVSYRVTSPGYYIIVVNWNEKSIFDSPFVCQVLECDPDLPDFNNVDDDNYHTFNHDVHF